MFLSTVVWKWEKGQKSGRTAHLLSVNKIKEFIECDFCKTTSIILDEIKDSLIDGPI
jgi:hypothetical protein